MGCRGLCCCPGLAALNEDNARFVLLAALILLYMLCGAAIFSALEQPGERLARDRWSAHFDTFALRHNLSTSELHTFLAEYELAYLTGVRVHDVRSRWDFPGAFYFVGTVVSTIGESTAPKKATSVNSVLSWLVELPATGLGMASIHIPGKCI